MSCSVFNIPASDFELTTNILNGKFHIHVWISRSSWKVGLVWLTWTCLPTKQLFCSSPPRLYQPSFQE